MLKVVDSLKMSQADSAVGQLQSALREEQAAQGCLLRGPGEEAVRMHVSH